MTALPVPSPPRTPASTPAFWRYEHDEKSSWYRQNHGVHPLLPNWRYKHDEKSSWYRQNQGVGGRVTGGVAGGRPR